MALDVPAVQRFAAKMLEANSRKTIVNLLGTFFAILEYARKCRMRVHETTVSALTIAADREETEAPYFKSASLGKQRSKD
jgi:hypothetical protein